jgi:hypothetical protein
MSLAELKENAAALSPQERFQLAAFLAELDERDESKFNEMIARRMASMDAGKKVTMEEFEAEHRRRAAQGR